MAEVYPSLWKDSFEGEGHTGDPRDAYSVAAWKCSADCYGSLPEFPNPILTADEQEVARIEGWILGSH